ncbi:MAG: putative binding protein (contains domain) [Proteobacteria bacterium]|nr:putative binding protein (contains domain) [Pseudomonadota bacterium]
MMQRTGDRVEVSGAMTLVNARLLLDLGVKQLEDGAEVFDLASVRELDSASIAVLFGWQRAAAAAGKSVRILNPPRNLLSLAELYGVAELLPLA